MKYLLLIAVVVVVLWLLRSRATRRRAPPPGAAPQAILPCRHCGVHLPQTDAVAGAQGYYCCEAHRVAQGDRG